MAASTSLSAAQSTLTQLKRREFQMVKQESRAREKERKEEEKPTLVASNAGGRNLAIRIDYSFPLKVDPVVTDLRWYEGNESSSIEKFRDCYEQCKVYMLDEGNQQWVEVELGRLLVLCGFSFTFSILALDFLPTGCKGNCVIFTDVESDTLGKDIEWSECKKVFDLEDGRFDTILNHPYYAQLFWPSPTQLRMN